MTKLNQDILNLIMQSEGHMTAEETFFLAKKQNIRVSMASTYRILGKLADDGKIKRISVPGMADIFDKTLLEHDHMICDLCGRIRDLDLGNFKETLEKQSGSPIISYNLSVRYICPDCMKENEKNN